MQSSIPEFKVVLFGGAKSGKTAFLKRFITGEFQSTYVPTVGVEVYSIVLDTTHGQVRLNIWDVPGDQKFAGLRSGSYIAADAAVYFKKDPLETTYLKEFLEINPDVPVVNVTSFSDMKKVTSTNQLPFYSVSAKSNDNFDKPFMYLMRELIDPKLCMI